MSLQRAPNLQFPVGNMWLCPASIPAWGCGLEDIGLSSVCKNPTFFSPRARTLLVGVTDVFALFFSFAFSRTGAFGAAW